MCMATLAEGALQTTKHLMETVEDSCLAYGSEESPLLPQEADGGVGSIRLAGHEEHFGPATTPAEAVSVTTIDAESEEEGQNTAEARLLYLQQGIDRLVSC